MADASSNSRPKIQLKNLAVSLELQTILGSHHTVLFLSNIERGTLGKLSKKALTLMREFNVDAHHVEVPIGSELEQNLASYSGWQYFPQLYVAGEFIGGNLVIPEFFRSGEYNRILAHLGIGFPLCPTPNNDTHGILSAVWKISSSDDQAYILVSRADGSIEMIYVPERITQLRVNSHAGWVNVSRFDVNGNNFYSGGSDTILRLWSSRSGSVTHLVPAHQRWINDIAVDPSSRYVASAGADRIVRFWDPVSLRLLSESTLHRSNIWCAFALEEALVSGDEEGSVAITGARAFDTKKHFRAHSNGVTGICGVPIEQGFCTTGFDGMAYGWDLEGRCLFQYAGHEERVWCAQPINEVDMMSTASADGYVDIWDINSGQCVQRFQYDVMPLSLCYLKAERLLVVGHMDGSLTWNRL